MKKSLSFVLVAFVFVFVVAFSGQVAHAKEKREIEVPPMEYNSTDYSIMAKKYLKMWSDGIEKVGLNEVDMKVVTETYGIRHIVGAQIYLERYMNGTWVNAGYAGDYYNVITDRSVKYGSATVARGYYYRVKSLHYAIYNGDREEAWGTSPGVLVP